MNSNTAEKFYLDKLKTNPSMPRYNHLLASICSQKGDADRAENYYRSAIVTAPKNIMVRNDFALHLMRDGRKKDAEHELNKALLQVDDNATLLNSNATILAKSGQYKPALDAATKARYLNPNDPLNHRNLAKLYNALGDSHLAYQHNIESIQLENAGISGSGGDESSIKDKANAYRAAAIQVIAKGGQRETALSLVSNARNLEGKKFLCSTTDRTNAIMFKVMQRKNAAMEIKKKEEEDAAAAMKAAMDAGPTRSFTLPDIKKRENDEEDDSDQEYDENGEKVEKKPRRRHRVKIVKAKAGDKINW